MAGTGRPHSNQVLWLSHSTPLHRRSDVATLGASRRIGSLGYSTLLDCSVQRPSITTVPLLKHLAERPSRTDIKAPRWSERPSSHHSHAASPALGPGRILFFQRRLIHRPDYNLEVPSFGPSVAILQLYSHISDLIGSNRNLRTSKIREIWCSGEMTLDDEEGIGLAFGADGGGGAVARVDDGAVGELQKFSA